LHKVPNVCIAKWGTHNVVRVLFPELGKVKNSPSLSRDEHQIFYEKGLRPAIQELLGDLSAEWPATYNDEMFRARGRNGQLSFQTKVVSAWHVPFLSALLRHHLDLNNVSWAKGLVFLHQIRGVKHSSFHSFNSDSATKALHMFVRANNLNYAIFSSGSWWFDVGIEIRSQAKNCLSWRTDSHFHLVQDALKINPNAASRITSLGSSKYTRDLVSHIPLVSGCRIEPGSQASGPYDIAYFQTYSTDKSLIYRQDQGHSGKFITCIDVLKGKGTNYIESLYNLYANAITDNNSHARLEVRVPLSHANTVLLDLDHNLLGNSLVSFPPVIWW